MKIPNYLLELTSPRAVGYLERYPMNPTTTPAGESAHAL